MRGHIILKEAGAFGAPFRGHRMRTTLAVSAVVVASWAAVAGFPARDGQRTFRTGVDVVTLGVTVVDRKGNLLTDLSQGDFEVYEDGQRQALQFFVPCDAQPGRDSGSRAQVELHLGALLDISGSMDEDMRFARDAYLLQALATCRARGGRLDLLLGKTSAAGDPLRPSRLLLRCPDAELPDRIAYLFRPAEVARANVPWHRAWRLRPRRPPTRKAS